jgi:hypothetical protein
MKSVCAFTRKPGLSRAAFQGYYEMHHALLAVMHFPFRGYARNHVLPGQRARFETISEFWADDPARLTDVLAGPSGAIMAADEAQFMGRERITPAAAVETRLSPGAQTNAAGLRWLVLLSWAGETVQDDLHNWARDVASFQPGVSLDILHLLPGAKFPAQALLWLPDFTLAPPPPPRLTLRALRVRRAETAKKDLLPP